MGTALHRKRAAVLELKRMTGKREMMTSSSATLSLFAEPTNPPKRPSSVMLSLLLHTMFAGVVYYGVTHLPRIIGRPMLDQGSVQRIDVPGFDPDFPNLPDLHRAESQLQQLSADAVREFNAARSPQLNEEMLSFLSHIAGLPPVIPPDIPARLRFASQIPRPNLTTWTPAAFMHQRFIATAEDSGPAPEIETLPALPGQAIRAAEIPVPSRELPPSEMALATSPTSALPDGLAPALRTTATTAATALESAASAASLSIPELHTIDAGLLLPPAREIAATNPAETVAAQEEDFSARTDDVKREQAADTAANEQPLSTEHVALPKDGRFGVVAVGISLEEEYPQAADIWADRVAYTAYLHVGLRKTWILQYSATPAMDMAGAGQVQRLDAPWPYDILRPNLPSRDAHAGALMVHGVLNQAGRLESLAVASPNRFRYASFVLRALSQWQFRPAVANGQATPVEVLLIIPEEMD